MKAALAYGVLLAASFTPALAAPQCGPRAMIEGALASEFEEAPVAQGLSQGGHMLRLLVNMQTRTWTVILAMPDGNACVVDSGEGLELVRPPIPGRDG